ncbi:MAG: AAA family ATPase [Mycoplasma sp.]|nr:AAA family ATPase [Mycoplasma sp.]
MKLQEALKTLRRRFEEKNILYISGNVYDKYQEYDEKKPTRNLTFLPKIISNIAIENEYENVLYFRPEQGITNLLKEKDENFDGIDNVKDFLQYIATQINQKDEKKNGDVYIVDLADIFFSEKNQETYITEISKILSAIVLRDEKKAINIVNVSNNSKFVLIMRDNGNIISDISNKNNEYALVNIPYPDINERSNFISTFGSSFGTNDQSDLKLKESKVHKEALVLTSGMSFKEILQMARLSESIDLTFKELFNISKFNKTKSDWEKIDYDRVKNIKKELSESVKGQDFAISNVERVIKNSLLGLNGVMNGENNKKPKGILFFAGPTGVGKTELAKSITKFVFGDESRMIRFDMSEFSEEQSDQRLIGAPPGFVGYDNGGELTNAVRENPQSIILFDEIEKANPRILDKFLQILEDGRLTSSKGELIDFSETFIIFTSNIGAKNADNKIEDEKNRKIFKDAVEREFRVKIGRPEILNRIGLHNIIPFNFITDKEILMKIFESKLNKLIKGLLEKHNVKINYSDSVREEVFEIVENEYDPRNGGRGLIAAMETTIQNSLIDYIFENKKEFDEDEDITNINMLTRKENIIFEK